MRYSTAGVLALLTLGLTVRPVPVSSTPTSQPNIIVIMTDDQRWDTVGPLSAAHLDFKDGAPPPAHVMTNVETLLVQHGVTFTNAFATTPHCAPSRATLLTGQYAFTHGRRGNGGQFRRGQDHNLLPTWLQKPPGAAYRTGYFGKYTNHYNRDVNVCSPPPDGSDPNWPWVPPGWTKWVAFKGQGRYGDPAFDQNAPAADAPCAPSQQDAVRVFATCEGSRLHPPPPAPPTGPTTDTPAVCKNWFGYSLDHIRRQALDFISTPDPTGAPFFLVFAPKAPHGRGSTEDDEEDDGDDSINKLPVPRASDDAAFNEVEDWRPRSHPLHPQYEPPHDDEDDDDPQEPEWLNYQPTLDAGLVDDIRRESLEALRSVDDAVGQLVAAANARDAQHGTDTYIIFTSDNGFFWGEHKLESKRAAYEEAIRVPLVIRPPLGTLQGRLEDRPALNIDLAPTILDMAGKSAGDCMDGSSLKPFLEETVKPASFVWRTGFVTEHAGGQGVPEYASWRLVTPARKYVDLASITIPRPSPSPPVITGTEREYYKLGQDPNEVDNLGQDPQGNSAVVMNNMAFKLALANPLWHTPPDDLVLGSTFECRPRLRDPLNNPPVPNPPVVPAWSYMTDDPRIREVPNAALLGTARGLEVEIVPNIPLHVQDDRPTAEPRYQVRFAFHPNGVITGNPEDEENDEVTLLFAGEESNRRLVAVQLEKVAGTDTYNLILRAHRQQLPGGLDNRWAEEIVNITNGPHVVEFDWQKATGTNTDGYLHVWIDQPWSWVAPGPGLPIEPPAPAVVFPPIDTGEHTIDFIRMGAISVKPGASGKIYLDEYASRRTNFIGY